MGKLHLPPTHSPGSLPPELAPLGAAPRTSYLRRAADGMNAIATLHKKLVQAKCQNVVDMETQAFVAESGGFSQVYPWPFYFRTGENTSGLRLRVGFVDNGFALTTSANIVITIHLASDGSVVGEKTLFFNGRGAPSSAWQTLNHTNVGTITLYDLTPNTEHYVVLECNDGVRVMYFMAHEVADAHADDAVQGVVDPTKFLTNGPIYDEHVEDLLGAGDAHFRHGGCHYLSWNPDYWESVTVDATSYTNVIDGSSTSYSAATPGVTLAAEHHGHAASGAAGPGARLAVKATREAGAGSLSVRLHNGTDSMEITGITTGGVGDWYVANVNVPDGIEKWDVQAKVSVGGTEFDLRAVCLFAYEAGP